METSCCTTGLVCLLIFRGLAGIPYGPIWDWSEFISAVDYRHILLGGLLRHHLKIAVASIMSFWIHAAGSLVGACQPRSSILTAAQCSQVV